MGITDIACGEKNCVDFYGFLVTAARTSQRVDVLDGESQLSTVFAVAPGHLEDFT